MPARGLAPTPREYVVRGEWPDGPLQRGAPFEAQKAADIATRLRSAIGNRSLRSVAAVSGVSIGTLHNLLCGKTWGDVVTIARLEQALSADLWSASPSQQASAASANAYLASRPASDESAPRGARRVN